eukprot:GHVU01049507.1.p3 GENE.GHVU01049507.1~~GHVU01049507.1.p3  ORF type:complete len:131 (+),score=6.89 GHVU01049507.1:883-1275(+)
MRPGDSSPVLDPVESTVETRRQGDPSGWIWVGGSVHGWIWRIHGWIEMRKGQRRIIRHQCASNMKIECTRTSTGLLKFHGEPRMLYSKTLNMGQAATENEPEAAAERFRVPKTKHGGIFCLCGFCRGNHF